MGSGLILLVIVGAWLAVLVPMALRSQESNSQSTVEAFHDAMRVLSRREIPAPVATSPSTDSALMPTGFSAPARRRRVLLGLVLFALVTLVGAVLGPLWVLGVHLVADLLVLGYVGHLRHLAVLRRDRELRDRRRRAVTESVQAAAASRAAVRAAPGLDVIENEAAVVAASSRTTDVGAVVAAARRAQARGATVAGPARASSRIAGVPDRMPSRAVVGTALYSLPVEQALEAAVEPARGAQGAAWSPVPVPLPAYLTAPVAPRRAAAAARNSDEGELRDEAVERKLAVND